MIFSLEETMTIEELRELEQVAADAVQDFRSAVYERLNALGYDDMSYDEYVKGANPEIDELLEMGGEDF